MKFKNPLSRKTAKERQTAIKRLLQEAGRPMNATEISRALDCNTVLVYIDLSVLEDAHVITGEMEPRRADGIPRRRLYRMAGS